ncbi:uncharacterized protein LOC143284175 [Babylonia areolata]|uniref:uncharacterized protein LOC143284175 n=1 Tax=Babylonia areolata TaxID=304850 RepID=UPI003FD347B3
MSGISSAAVWCGAVCVVMVTVLLPPGESTGVFEVQLTSLINGWGLTHDGLCCSLRRTHTHNHIHNHITDPFRHHNPRPTGYDDDSNSNNNNNNNNKLEVHVKNNIPKEEEEKKKEEEEQEEEEEEQEEDWLCEEECRTFLHVCLSHLQDPLPTGSGGSTWCTFGSALSLVLGGNTLDPFGTWWEEPPEPDPEPNGGGAGDPNGGGVMVVEPAAAAATVVRIPFTFSWPGEYTLVVEAWHDEHGNRSTADRQHLIARAVEGGRLEPSTLWHNHTTSSTNTDLTFRFRVLCDSHYYGTGCDVLCRESDDPIIGHYGCDVNGLRVCLPGWEGESCDRAQCSEECSASHGFCLEPFKCRCRLGWRGVHCSQCQTFPDCLHGYCTEALQCLCETGWSGSLCNIDNFYCERYQPCENGATCEYDPNSNYTCSCPRGFGGRHCQLPVCYPGLCLNHGACEIVGGKRFCRCRGDFEGPRCEHAEVTCGSVSCRNNGTCTRVDRRFRCLCRPGFTGRLCEMEIDECRSNPCKHGGLCRDRLNGYHCECTSGYAGRNCDLTLDPCLGFKCFNHGTCITVGAGFTPSCLCRPEFTGQRCETPLDPCVGIACLHGGTCLRTGSASFHCACADGYSGSVCQIPPPSLLCKEQPCLNGGTCRRTRNGVMMCACAAGFGGALCEERREGGSTVVVEPVTTEGLLGRREFDLTSSAGGMLEEVKVEEEAEEEKVEEEEDPGGESPGNFQASSSCVRFVACRTLLFLAFSLTMLVRPVTRCCSSSNDLFSLSS